MKLLRQEYFGQLSAHVLRPTFLGYTPIGSLCNFRFAASVPLDFSDGAYHFRTPSPDGQHPISGLLSVFLWGLRDVWRCAAFVESGAKREPARNWLIRPIFLLLLYPSAWLFGRFDLVKEGTKRCVSVWQYWLLQRWRHAGIRWGNRLSWAALQAQERLSYLMAIRWQAQPLVRRAMSSIANNIRSVADTLHRAIALNTLQDAVVPVRAQRRFRFLQDKNEKRYVQ